MIPLAVGWDAEAAARELEREWMLASSLAEQRAIIARHLTLARSTAPTAERTREAAAAIFKGVVGDRPHQKQLEFIEKQIAIACALPPAQPPATTSPSVFNDPIMAREVDRRTDTLRRALLRQETAHPSTTTAVRRAVQDGEPE